MAGPDGTLYTPEGVGLEALSLNNITTTFQKIAEECYTSFKGTISCGNLTSQVFISPAPMVKIFL